MSDSRSDLSGFSQLFRNFVFGWGSYLFVLIIGFVVPRQISDRLGPELLGIWDLGWATTRYLHLSNLGIGPAVTRFVALYRAENNIERLCSVRTSATYMTFIMAGAVVLVSALAAHFIAEFADISSESDVRLAKIVLFLLGISVVANILGFSAAGIVTGCHRFDITLSINAAGDAVLAVAMILVLQLGGGLEQLALAVIAIASLGAFAKFVAARHICPEAKVAFRYLDWKRSRELLRFGGKAVVSAAPSLIIFQTSIILLSGMAGTTAVAILTRGMALVRHCEQLAQRAAMFFMPITSGLVGLQEKEKIRRLLTQMGSYGLGLTLPMLLILFILGDLVLQLWMGPAYANKHMIQILSAGAVLPVAQLGTRSVLAGLNAHGRLALASVAVSGTALLGGIPIIGWLGWSPETAAALIAFTWTCGQGLVMPVFLKIRYDLPILRYLAKTIAKPTLLNIPLVLLLVGSRSAFERANWVIGIFLVLFGLLVSGGLYWQFLLPGEVKEGIAKRLRKSSA